MGRKVRGDAKLEQLNEAQRAQLHFWFDENLIYSEVVKLVQQHFGLSVGRSTVAAYWKRHIMPQRQQDEAEIVATLAALPAGDFDAAIIQQARVLAWTALAQSHPDIDKAAKLLEIVRKAERHALAVKRLELEERRVALRERLANDRPRAAATPTDKRNEARPETPPAAPTPGEAPAVVPVSCEATPVASEGPELPRCPGYSGVRRPEGEAGSAGVIERGGPTEVATKARSGEGQSKGTEDLSNFPAAAVGFGQGQG